MVSVFSFFAFSESHIWEVIHFFLLGTTFLSVLPIPPTCFCCWSHRILTSATAVLQPHVCCISSLELSRAHNNQEHLCLSVHHSHDFCTLILKDIILSPDFYAFPSRLYGCLYDVLLFVICFLWELLLSFPHFYIILLLAICFSESALLIKH